jgi:peroxiredoxin 2/4
VSVRADRVRPPPRRVPEAKRGGHRGVHRLAVHANAWRNTPVDKGGIGAVGYPLVADLKHEIVKAYDVETDGGVAFRGSFLIDKAGVVRHQVVNDLPLGRNIDEMLRMVDALQFTEEHGEVCPAGWNKGKKGMKANPSGVAGYLASHAKEL